MDGPGIQSQDPPRGVIGEGPDAAHGRRGQSRFLGHRNPESGVHLRGEEKRLDVQVLIFAAVPRHLNQIHPQIQTQPVLFSGPPFVVLGHGPRIEGGQRRGKVTRLRGSFSSR